MDARASARRQQGPTHDHGSVGYNGYTPGSRLNKACIRFPSWVRLGIATKTTWHFRTSFASAVLVAQWGWKPATTLHSTCVTPPLGSRTRRDTMHTAPKSVPFWVVGPNLPFGGGGLLHGTNPHVHFWQANVFPCPSNVCSVSARLKMERGLMSRNVFLQPIRTQADGVALCCAFHV